MDVPLELARLGLTAQEERAVDAVVARWVSRLNRRYPDLVSCRVAVERPQASVNGNPYRIRIRATIRGHAEVVVVKGPQDNDKHLDVRAVVRAAFHAVLRALERERQKIRGEVKRHDPDAVYEDVGTGIVVRINRQSAYGFLRTMDGREVYFHAHAVVSGGLEALEVGSTVRFEAEDGEDGPQATTVQVVQRAPHKDGPSDVGDPEGWRRVVIEDAITEGDESR